MNEGKKTFLLSGLDWQSWKQDAIDFLDPGILSGNSVNEQIDPCGFQENPYWWWLGWFNLKVQHPNIFNIC